MPGETGRFVLEAGLDEDGVVRKRSMGSSWRGALVWRGGLRGGLEEAGRAVMGRTKIVVADQLEPRACPPWHPFFPHCHCRVT